MASFSLFILSFLAIAICFISASLATRNRGITVDLIHRDSHNSPFYNASESVADRFRRSIQRSNSRYSWFKSRVLKTHSPSALEAPITNGGGGYLMKVQIGTPGVDVVAIADTGSDLTWAQCKPCTRCYPQDAPLFDPTQSSTYQQVACSGGFCKALGSMGNGCDSQDRCLYQITYGDRSFTRGNLAKDTFTLQSSTGKATSFPNVAFGCSKTSTGTFDRNTAGIIGLGGGATSIVRQLGGATSGVFSYCLTPDANATSKISFGRDAIVKGPGVLKTPMITQDTFYFLNLDSVSVGDTKIAYKASSRPMQIDDVPGNIIIDSGTTLTYLPSDMYQEVISSLKKAVKGNPVEGELDLCYKAEAVSSAPAVTANFKGGTSVRLSEKGVFIKVSEGVVCAAFADGGGQGFGIFGNLHQIDYRIGYDIDGQALSFLSTDCSRP